MTNGPVKKFQLIKTFGSALRAAGYEPKEMSCEQIEAALRSMGVMP
jgi:hypothetical protein